MICEVISLYDLFAQHRGRRAVAIGNDIHRTGVHQPPLGRNYPIVRPEGSLITTPSRASQPHQAWHFPFSARWETDPESSASWGLVDPASFRAKLGHRRVLAAKFEPAGWQQSYLLIPEMSSVFSRPTANTDQARANPEVWPSDPCGGASPRDRALWYARSPRRLT